MDSNAAGGQNKAEPQSGGQPGNEGQAQPQGQNQNQHQGHHQRRFHHHHHHKGKMRERRNRGGLGGLAAQRPSFDVYMVDDFFPKVDPTTDNESTLNQALLQRNADLTPPPEENSNLVNLISKLQMVLENITLTPGTLTDCQIEEVRQVGSFKKGTLIAGKKVADLVVILKTPPALEAIKQLGAKVLEELIKMEPQMELENREAGFEIRNTENGSTVRVLIATAFPNFKKLDPTVHVPQRVVQRHLAAIRHIRWFEESANLTSVKVLIRVLKDIVSRFPGLQPLNPWMIDVLSHYSLTYSNQQQPLPLSVAFKRVFQLLAGGIFLCGSTGIPDPCGNGGDSIHGGMSYQQQDNVCMTAQTLLRIMSCGNGYRVVIGLDPDPVGVLQNSTVWDGVVVAPCGPAYEPKQQDQENDGEGQNQMDEGASGDQQEGEEQSNGHQ